MTMRTWVLMVVTTVLGATLALGQTKPSDTVQRCRRMLDDAAQDKNPDIRKSAAEALSLVGIRDSPLQSLGPMLEDHDVTVRIAVISSLADFKDKSVIPLLKKALMDPVPEVDFAAAKALYELHDPDGLHFLLDVVSGESRASSSYLTKEKRNTLRLLHTPTKLFTTVAISAASFGPVPGLGLGLSSAQGILSEPDASSRAAALLLIGNTHDPALKDAVASAFTDKEWSVRAAAANLSATHPFPEFQQRLVTLLDDDKDPVRLRAAAAYIRLEERTRERPRR
jgi:HEAT repeat protein